MNDWKIEELRLEEYDKVQKMTIVDAWKYLETLKTVRDEAMARVSGAEAGVHNQPRHTLKDEY